MAKDRMDDLNDTTREAPGGSQATHSAAESIGESDNVSGMKSRGPRARVADTVDRAGDTLERRAIEMELKGGVKAKAAPAIRRASRAADVSAAYVREKNITDMRADLESEIREHPLKSIAIALGAGYLLAKILD